MRRREKKSIISPLKKKCFLCGSLHGTETHNIIDEWGNEKLSKRYGLTVPLCPLCHDKVHADKLIDLQLKQVAQVAFRENYPDKDFIEIFGRDYLHEKIG